jgi:hypothetical protein
MLFSMHDAVLNALPPRARVPLGARKATIIKLTFSEIRTLNVVLCWLQDFVLRLVTFPCIIRGVVNSLARAW